jgi:hypothetical protein
VLPAIPALTSQQNITYQRNVVIPFYFIFAMRAIGPQGIKYRLISWQTPNTYIAETPQYQAYNKNENCSNKI